MLGAKEGLTDSLSPLMKPQKASLSVHRQAVLSGSSNPQQPLSPHVMHEKSCRKLQLSDCSDVEKSFLWKERLSFWPCVVPRTRKILSERRNLHDHLEREAWKALHGESIALSLDSGLPHYTRNSMGTSRNVSEKTTCSRKILSPSLPGTPQSSTIPTPRFSRNLDAWISSRRTGGTCSQNCTMETPRCAISELHFGKFTDPDVFQCWRGSFKTEVCVSTCTLELTMSWIDEVEIARFIDDLMTS